MSEFLKGNFKTKREVVEKTTDQAKGSGQALVDEVRKKVLNSLGGSMVYIERTELAWDGEDEKE